MSGGDKAAPLVVVVGNLTIDDVVNPDGSTHMASVGGNSVHTATAVVVAGARAAVVARRGEDFPAAALQLLESGGVDVSGLVDVPGPTVRNWVVYEADGRRHWLYRTPPQRSAEVAPQPQDLAPAQLGAAAVVHIAAMPLGNAEAVVAHVRTHAPRALITLDTHESWDAAVAKRVFALAQQVDLFLPSIEELAALTQEPDPVGALAALAAAGVPTAVVKVGGDGAYVRAADGSVRHVPALPSVVVDLTGAGDTFCGGVAAGLAQGMATVASAALGAAVAGTAIGSTGSLRLFEARCDPALILAQARRLGASAKLVAAPSEQLATRIAVATAPTPDEYAIDVMRREIEMIPDVVSDVLDDAGGHVAALARQLVDEDVRHLWLTGCGDSAFAGLAAELAFRKHSGLVPHALHALDLARYQVRYLPPGSAVVALSFSGKVGRTTEAAAQARRFGHRVIALTNAPDGQLAAASDQVLPIDVRTLGFSPGTSTYVGMLTTLLSLAAHMAELRGDDGRARRSLGELPPKVAQTLEATAGPALDAAKLLLGTTWVAFLGAGPNEATARFGAAKLFEGPQLVGVSTNLEEWAHEQYFVTSPGDPVVLVNPSGAGASRGNEILDELRFMGALPVLVSDVPPSAGTTAGELLLRLAPGVPEELSPVTACLPLALMGFHLAQLGGKQSYNFVDEASRVEHYDTIHRATSDEPA